MKQLTCRELGGPCDAVIKGSSPEEMSANGTKHVMQNHPDIVEQMKTMSQGDRDAWTAELAKKWATAADM